MLTKAEDAVRYILGRVATDVNFAWYMFGTESLARCMAAESERTGRTREDIESKLYHDIDETKRRRGIKGPDVSIAEKRLSDIEDAVHELDGYHGLNTDNWSKLRDKILARD